MSSNPGQVELGVHSTSVVSRTRTKNIITKGFYGVIKTFYGILYNTQRKPQWEFGTSLKSLICEVLDITHLNILELLHVYIYTANFHPKSSTRSFSNDSHHKHTKRKTRRNVDKMYVLAIHNDLSPLSLSLSGICMTEKYELLSSITDRTCWPFD